MRTVSARLSAGVNVSGFSRFLSPETSVGRLQRELNQKRSVTSLDKRQRRLICKRQVLFDGSLLSFEICDILGNDYEELQLLDVTPYSLIEIYLSAYIFRECCLFGPFLDRVHGEVVCSVLPKPL
jgi:hypothetical protein